jgi:hypothetical protein
MKTEGSELDILQQKFVDRLQQAVGRMQHRLQAIRQALDEKSLGNAELIESLEEGGWNERLSQLFERLKELQAKAEVRQTLVVVGKRGSRQKYLIAHLARPRDRGWRASRAAALAHGRGRNHGRLGAVELLSQQKDGVHRGSTATREQHGGSPAASTPATPA